VKWLGKVELHYVLEGDNIKEAEKSLLKLAHKNGWEGITALLSGSRKNILRNHLIEPQVTIYAATRKSNQGEEA